jgi:hypothetical protein
MEQRKGPFQVNASGGRWWPLDPRPDDFAMEDIGHHLAMICRYGGAPRFFYSVAEHSVLVSRHVPPELALHGLLHDAAEAVVGDTIKPIKVLSEWDAVRRIEDRNFRAICTRFGLDWSPEIEAIVSDVDRRLVIDECLALIPNGADYLRSKGCDLSEALGAEVLGYTPERAECAFLLRWWELAAEVSS